MNIELKKGIYWVGVVDWLTEPHAWDRITLFNSLFFNTLRKI